MIQFILLLAATISTCASTCTNGKTRIMNGTDATQSDFPYVVSFRFDLNHDCGGSILDEYHVLTAAHCVHGRGDARNYSIQYGLTVIANNTVNSINVSKVYIHKQYAPLVAYANDVAVLKLVSPIPLSTNVTSVTLPASREAVPENATAITIGWGVSNRTHPKLTPHLQKASVRVYPQTDCPAATCYFGNPKYVLCAGIPEDGKGSCGGDSGGPLVIGNKLIGIVSWGLAPCSKASPGAYVKVAKYVDWIKNKIGK